MTAKRGSDPGALVPADRAGPPAVRDPAVMRDWAEVLVARARDEGVELTDEASAFERVGLPVVVVRGSERAMKVTEERDFARLEAIAGIAE